MTRVLQHTKWLVMSTTVFVDFVGESTIFLYDTLNRFNRISHDKNLISLIRLLYQPKNLGVVSYKELNRFASFDTKWALNEGIIRVVNIEGPRKPVNYLPILNLQKDINRNNDSIDERLQLIGSKSRYISGIFIKLSNVSDCRNSEVIRLRNIAASQHPCPSYENVRAWLTTESIKFILNRLRFTSIAIVDLIFAISCFEHYSYAELMELLSKYDYSYRIHLYSEDFCRLVPHIKSLDMKERVSLIVYKDRFSDIDFIYSIKNTPIKVIQKFLIYDEHDLLSHTDIGLPVWTGDNYSLFSKYVWTDISDLYESKASFNTIFRNQKLNSNFFGIIDIEPSGDIFAHGSSCCIGNIHKTCFSFAEIVSKEFKENHSWRLTRDLTNCAKCPYRFICPPVSIYEIQRSDIKMCHINPTEL